MLFMSMSVLNNLPATYKLHIPVTTPLTQQEVTVLLFAI